MATGNVLKDNGYTITGRIFDDGFPTITANNFYCATPGKALWITKLRFYGPAGGAFAGSTVRLSLFVPGNPLDTTGNVNTNRVYTTTTTSADGWNEITLPTPVAMPVYSGTGAIQKISVGIMLTTNTAYVADNALTSAAVQSGTISGLYISANTDSNTPVNRGSFQYNPETGGSGAGTFNFWNGADIEVTDVNPSGGPISWSGTATATSGSTGTFNSKQNISGTAAATSATSGAFSARLAIAGTAVATSASTGAFTSRQGISGTAAAVSGTSGAFRLQQPWSGIAAAISDSSGAFTVQSGANFNWSGVAAAVSGSTGAFSLRAALAGTAAAVSGSSGAFSTRGSWSGVAAAISASTGAFTGKFGIVLVPAAAVSGSSATFGGKFLFSGTAVAVSGAYGDFTIFDNDIPAVSYGPIEIRAFTAVIASIIAQAPVTPVIVATVPIIVEVKAPEGSFIGIQ